MQGRFGKQSCSMQGLFWQAEPHHARSLLAGSADVQSEAIRVRKDERLKYRGRNQAMAWLQWLPGICLNRTCENMRCRLGHVLRSCGL